MGTLVSLEPSVPAQLLAGHRGTVFLGSLIDRLDQELPRASTPPQAAWQ